MNLLVVIPVFNEEENLELFLESLLAQTRMPDEIIIINDNSTDNSEDIILKKIRDHQNITYKYNKSSDKRIPGGKVIETFYKGLECSSSKWDIVFKLDADLILPPNYFYEVEKAYINTPNIGMAGGHCYIKEKKEWVYEAISDKEHLRGPLKSYRHKCFEDIKGLKKSIGWDSLDVLLARHNGWDVYVNSDLKVKHLRKTGDGYKQVDRSKEGKVFYLLGYDLMVTLISALKISMADKSIKFFLLIINAYFISKKLKTDRLVTAEEKKFINKYRKDIMMAKLTRRTD